MSARQLRQGVSRGWPFGILAATAATALVQRSAIAGPNIVLEAVGDYTTCGPNVTNLGTNPLTDVGDFGSQMALLGFPTVVNKTNSQVADTDFLNPNAPNSLLGDNGNQNFDQPGVAFAYFSGHGRGDNSGRTTALLYQVPQMNIHGADTPTMPPQWCTSGSQCNSPPPPGAGGYAPDEVPYTYGTDDRGNPRALCRTEPRETGVIIPSYFGGTPGKTPCIVNSECGLGLSCVGWPDGFFCTAPGCTEDAPCGYCDYTVYGREAKVQCVNPPNIHGGIVDKSGMSSYTQGAANLGSVAIGESYVPRTGGSGTWAGVATGGGTNVAIFDMSDAEFGLKLQEVLPLFAGLHLLLETFVHTGDYNDDSRRGGVFAQLAANNLDEPVASIWLIANEYMTSTTYFCQSPDGQTFLPGGDGINGCGGASAVAQDVTQAAADFHTQETFYTVEQDIYDPTGSGTISHIHDCNWDCWNAYPMLLP